MRYGIVLGSNERSRLAFAAMEAVTRTSLGDEVQVFLTMDAVKGFTKEAEVRDSLPSSEATKKDDRSYLELFRIAKKTGRAKLYACSYASRLFNLGKESFQSVVDDIEGLTPFMAEVDGPVSSVW